MLEALQQELVEISHEIQDEVVGRIIALIKHERKRRSWWNKIKLFFSRFKRCSCMCGCNGVGCECEQMPPPQVLPEVIKWHSGESKSQLEKAEEEKTPRDLRSTIRMPDKQEHNQSGLRKRSSIAYI
jgi:hypothetical protein